MKVNYVKLTAGVLTGFMALSSVPDRKSTL